MDYETGVSTSPLDLLTKLAVFAAANGWSADAPTSTNPAGLVLTSEGTGPVCVVAIHTGPLWVGTPEPQLTWLTRGALAYNGAATYDAQTGDCGWEHTMNLGAGPFTAYHFFAGDEDGFQYLHVVVEVEAGEFRHWVAGNLVPYGVIDGGAYNDSTYLSLGAPQQNQPESSLSRHICDAGWNDDPTAGMVQVDFDGKTDNWVPIIAGNSPINPIHGIGTVRNQGGIISLQEVGYQRYNLRTPLWPLEYFVNRAADVRSAVGRIPHMRAVNMALFSPAEIHTIGGDDWMMFPVFARQSADVADTIVSSGLYGYAYRR